MTTKIYIVEDDPDIAELIQFNLEKEGFETLIENNGKKAYELIIENPPDLLLLDIGLPGLSGIEICKYLREQAITRDLPIIMLTARTQETDKVVGLNIGADDYITKPCSVNEVVARVNALLRRSKPSKTDVFRSGKLEINFNLRTVECDNNEIEVTPTEFNILSALINAKGRVLSRQDLMDIVWGADYYGDTRTVDVNIKRLRDKLSDCSKAIHTVKGVGYRIILN
ncbi:MAG: response regulator transcription factor [Bacteroidetes bacterium]|nr:response regulator transcription factor [Bacteroidota bacterium]